MLLYFQARILTELKSHPESRLPVRIAVVLPPCFTAVDAWHLCDHTDNTYVSSVVACVNVNAVFSDSRNTVPQQILRHHVRVIITVC